MRRRVLLVALLGLVPALASAGEQANAPSVTGETGYFNLLTGDTLPAHGWSFGLYYNNWDRIFKDFSVPGFVPTVDKRPAYDWDRVAASVGVGITDRWEASVLVPYDNFHGFDTRRTGGLDFKASGQGPVRLGTKLRLFGDRGADTTFAINGFVDFATSSNEIKDVVSDSTGYGVGLDWRIRNWVLNLGYYDNGGDDPIIGPKATTAGIGYAGRVGSRLDWITEINADFYTGGRFLKLKDSIDFTTGGRLWLGESQNWAFNFALRTDLNQLSSTGDHCPLGGLVGLTYFPVFHAPPPPPPAPEPPPPPPPPAPEPPPPPAPAPPPPPPPPPAPAPKPEERVTVNFTPGSARLSNIAKAKLDEVALKMKQDPTLRAQVLGYGDTGKGTTASEQRLSEQRAQAVKNYLVTRHGIDPSRITTEGRGTQDSTGNPADDRRAVVILTAQ